jgi:hypothetical protein
LTDTDPVAELETADLGKTELEEGYPFEICFAGIDTDGIVTDGIDGVTADEAGIEGTVAADGIDTDGSPIVEPLPNFRSRPPNCTSN